MTNAVPEGQGTSKKAKQRAAKRAAAEAGEGAAPAPAAPPAAAAPKAKAKAQPAPAPAPEPAPKAKAKAKGAAAPAPAAPTPEPKAKSKAKAKAKAEPTPEPPAPVAEPKAKSKAAAKPGAKQKAKPAKEEVEEEPVRVDESKQELVNWVIDDGKGGDWEAVSGMTKKQQKRKENADRAKQEQAGGFASNLPANQARIPGMGAGDAASHAANLKGVSQSAHAEVSRILGKKGEVEAVAENNDKTATTTVVVPEAKIGIVIGPKGAKIKAIQEKTGVTRIDTQCDPWVIAGEPAKIALAKQAIEELASKNYCALLYENFAENMVNVHPTVFPDLIGKEGVVIRKLKDELGVEVAIPKVPANAPASKKFKVTLAGSAASVEKAKNCINEIIMYGHSELTHPGVVHAEMEVEPWAYKYIIGSKGSEMRHIQKNYNVKMVIPREHSANQNVLVVGEPRDVERAKAYVENSLWKAENQVSQGRDRIEATDDWGDEGEEEDWMKAYIYKR